MGRCNERLDTMNSRFPMCRGYSRARLIEDDFERMRETVAGKASLIAPAAFGVLFVFGQVSSLWRGTMYLATLTAFYLAPSTCIASFTTTCNVDHVRSKRSYRTLLQQCQAKASFLNPGGPSNENKSISGQSRQRRQRSQVYPVRDWRVGFRILAIPNMAPIITLLMGDSP